MVQQTLLPVRWVHGGEPQRPRYAVRVGRVVLETEPVAAECDFCGAFLPDTYPVVDRLAYCPECWAADFREPYSPDTVQVLATTPPDE